VTLRHYDEIGLLKPAAVDELTGYRYYSVVQLPRLNRILALKDLGLSLEQIDRVLSGLTLEQLREMLSMKQAEVEKQLAEEQTRLERINVRLRQIELEDSMSDIAVVLKSVPPMLIASRSVTIPTSSAVPAYLNAAFAEALAYARRHGAQDTGPCLAVWHQAADILANEVAEAAIPIDRAVPSTDQVRVYELPRAQVASVVHHGAFENFRQEHTAVFAWLEANGYRIAGPYREIYMNYDSGNMADSATEIQYPVEKGTYL
jgi:DNA-binding transcriptional MerR regulator